LNNRTGENANLRSTVQLSTAQIKLPAIRCFCNKNYTTLFDTKHKKFSKRYKNASDGLLDSGTFLAVDIRGKGGIYLNWPMVSLKVNPPSADKSAKLPQMITDN